MLSSSVFTFDESSLWDPKVIREYLDIPEDQLNILRNLPEWSKSRHTSNTSRIEKDTCENSQLTLLISDTTLDNRSEELILQNRVLFGESFETRKSILERYKLKSSKLFRSCSLFEIDKISNNLFCKNHLRRTLSIPNIYLFSENLYSKSINSEFRNSDSSPDRHLPPNKNIDLPVYKESRQTYITTEQTTTDTSDLKKSEDKTFSERSEMEVDAQLPVTNPCLIDQIKNNEKNCEILGENYTVPTSHALNSPNKLNTANDQPTSLTSPNKFPNGISSVNINAAMVTTSDNINLCEKNVCSAIENMPSKSCNPEVNETVSKLIKSGDPNSCEKNEPVLNITKETIDMDADITNENKRVETNANFQDMAKVNETYNQCTELNGISKELSTSEATVVSPNKPGIKIPCNSNISKKDVKHAQHTIIHKDVTGNKSVFAETLSVKRKLESKNRAMKKRRKQGEERSIKKACDVCYSVEHIKTMLDIMKQSI